MEKNTTSASTLVLFLLLIVVAAGAFAYFNNNGGTKIPGLTGLNSATNYVAYHNKHKDLEIMVNNFKQTHRNLWFVMQFGLLANEKVTIAEIAPYGFVAHYIINEPNEPLYELLCFANDDIPAFPRQDGTQGDPPKVDFAKRGFYQEVCNQKAEKIIQLIREKTGE